MSAGNAWDCVEKFNSRSLFVYLSNIIALFWGSIHQTGGEKTGITVPPLFLSWFNIFVTAVMKIFKRKGRVI